MVNSLLRSRAFAALLVALSVGLSAALTGCKSNATPAKEASPSHAGDAHSAHAKSAVSSADESLARLVAGNARYVAGKPMHPDQSIARRDAVSRGQKQFAVVLTCSDSRVPPELIFDTGLGDLFVVRVAGNTADPSAVGSMEYAVDHLHAPLIIVLGHDSCGAVQAAVEQAKTGTAPPAHIAAVTGPILPAVAKAKQQPGDLLTNAIRDNVDDVVEQLKTCKPVLNDAVDTGAIKIVGGCYDLRTGKVELK